ncbi:hypothetical protein GCM10018773_05670 [Streptomyces candidus]|nr:hypothetical protein GCM10018773_05670 [Streptomyces candidus]
MAADATSVDMRLNFMWFPHVLKMINSRPHRTRNFTFPLRRPKAFLPSLMPRCGGRVESEASGGTELGVDYRNDAWASTRTVWKFVVDGGKVTRFETGQA